MFVKSELFLQLQIKWNMQNAYLSTSYVYYLRLSHQKATEDTKCNLGAFFYMEAGRSLKAVHPYQYDTRT